MLVYRGLMRLIPKGENELRAIICRPQPYSQNIVLAAANSWDFLTIGANLGPLTVYLPE